MAHNLLNPAAIDSVHLHWGLFAGRYDVNKRYVMKLTNENLLQNFHLEAGLRSRMFRCTYNTDTSWGDDCHWGWESPSNQLRGHFPGHWLSAAAFIYANGADPAIENAEGKTALDIATEKNLAPIVELLTPKEAP